jgi:hypothetical protein
MPRIQFCSFITRHAFFLFAALLIALSPSSAHAEWITDKLVSLPNEAGAIVALDFDNDGDIDIFTTTRAGDLLLFEKNDAGNYSLKDTVAIGKDPLFLAIAGNRLIASNFSSASLTDVEFSPAGFSGTRTTPTQSFPMGLATGDLNGDGRSDIAQVNLTSANVEIRYAAPDDAFGPPITVRAGSGPRTVAIGDIDNDGHNDIIIATGAKSALVILRGSPTGFEAPQEFTAGVSFYGVHLVDLNTDGKLEILVTDIGANQILAFAFVDGSLRPLGNWAVLASPISLALADLNGDGRIDAAIATPQGLWILPGAQSGIFSSPERILTTPVSAVTIASPGAGTQSQALAVTQGGIVRVLWR